MDAPSRGPRGAARRVATWGVLESPGSAQRWGGEGRVLSAATINVGTLLSREEDLVAWAVEQDHDIVCLQEHRLHSQHDRGAFERAAVRRGTR